MLLHDEVVDVWISLEAGRIQSWGEGLDAEADAEGWIVPRFVNAHTHVADAFLRDREKPTTVAALVGPGGWKHQQLANADLEAQEDGVFALTDQMGRTGTSHFVDFREGGVEGVQWLRSLGEDMRAQPVILGRANETSSWAEVAEVADGVGISGMRDLSTKELEEAADTKKLVGVHVSEDQRDDMDAALALEPKFVVHMCHGTAQDFQKLADAEIPIVICPRSNRFFGQPTPVRAMLDAGCTVAVGTDNGMLADGDLRQELAGLPAREETLLRMASHSGRFLLGLDSPFPLRRGAELDALLLPFPAVPNGQTGKPRL